MFHPLLGWPHAQLMNGLIVWSVSYFSIQDRLLYLRRPILDLLIANWAILSTLQDPNTSNLAVSIRVSYRVPAYGRLCLMLVHTADSLLIGTNLL